VTNSAIPLLREDVPGAALELLLTSHFSLDPSFLAYHQPNTMSPHSSHSSPLSYLFAAAPSTLLAPVATPAPTLALAFGPLPPSMLSSFARLCTCSLEHAARSLRSISGCDETHVDTIKLRAPLCCHQIIPPACDATGVLWVVQSWKLHSHEDQSPGVVRRHTQHRSRRLGRRGCVSCWRWRRSRRRRCRGNDTRLYHAVYDVPTNGLSNV
jgi:hypothetical protein